MSFVYNSFGIFPRWSRDMAIVVEVMVGDGAYMFKMCINKTNKIQSEAPKKGITGENVILTKNNESLKW